MANFINQIKKNSSESSESYEIHDKRVPEISTEKNVYLHVKDDGSGLEWSTVAQGGASFKDLSGSPEENTNLKNALDAKANSDAIADMATMTWVEDQSYLTEHQDISGLATKDELAEVEGKIPSLDGYATEEYVDDAVAGIPTYESGIGIQIGKDGESSDNFKISVDTATIQEKLVQGDNIILTPVEEGTGTLISANVPTSYVKSISIDTSNTLIIVDIVDQNDQ